MPKKILKILSEKRKQSLREKPFPKNKSEQKFVNAYKAGKARAANAIKDDKGRYVNRILVERIGRDLAAQKGVSNLKGAGKYRKFEEVITEAQISPKELRRFYEYNRETYLGMLKNKSFKGHPHYSGKLEKVIKAYKGKIIIDNGIEKRTLSPAAANYELMRFNQYIKTHISAADFSITPSLSFDGLLTIKIPSVKEMMKGLKEKTGAKNQQDFDDMDIGDLAEAVTEYLDENFEDDVIIHVSPPKGKGKGKERGTPVSELLKPLIKPKPKK